MIETTSQDARMPVDRESQAFDPSFDPRKKGKRVPVTFHEILVV